MKHKTTSFFAVGSKLIVLRQFVVVINSKEVVVLKIVAKKNAIYAI